LPKEETLKIQGKVVEVLPNAVFKIQLENALTILGHISGKMRKNNIDVLLNDRVEVEMSLYDLSKGRVIFRYK
jgi:translation initiation factor IF-1